MTLATVLFICTSFSAPASVLRAAASAVPSIELQATPVIPPDSSPGQSPAPSNRPQQPAASSPAAPAQAPPGDKPSAGGKLRRHKKKAAKASTCTDSTTATTGAATATTGAAATPVDPSASADSSPAAKTAPVKCPPPKTVVHNGGTIEPAIQITSGEGAEQASSQRWTTDQLVGLTEENLKRITGRQLNSDQQEMLNQIHQFLDQSKVAIGAGDIERGHNLAMKARLLSDELAKP